jgi:hypothetical protein
LCEGHVLAARPLPLDGGDTALGALAIREFLDGLALLGSEPILGTSPFLGIARRRIASASTHTPAIGDSATWQAELELDLRRFAASRAFPGQEKKSIVTKE